MYPVVVTRQFYARDGGGIGYDPSLIGIDGRLINRRCLLGFSLGTVRGDGWGEAVKKGSKVWMKTGMILAEIAYEEDNQFTVARSNTDAFEYRCIWIMMRK